METPTLRTSQDITTCNYVIYIRSSTHTEYGIEILASPGIPGIELEKRYLEYFRIQLTSKKLYLEYRWTIQILSLVQTNSSFFHGNSSLFFINPARFHTNSSLFQFLVIEILSLFQSNLAFFHIVVYCLEKNLHMFHTNSSLFQISSI